MDRGFEIVSVYKNASINLPKRSTLYSAGYDIEAAEYSEIAPKSVVLVPTGIKAYMRKDEVLHIYIRSSMAVKRHVMLANNVGVIDADYYDNLQNEGHIFIPLYNFSDDLLIIIKGEKIAQGIFTKFLTVDGDEPKNEVRSGGFGSSNGNK